VDLHEVFAKVWGLSSRSLSRMATSLAVNPPLSSHPVKAEVSAAIIADDEVTLRRATAALRAASVNVLAAGRLCDEQVEHAESLRPDTVILACDLGRPAQMTSLRRLRKTLANAGIVVVAAANPRVAAREAVNNGADGFIFEADLESTLAIVVQAVAAGHVSIPRRMRRSVVRPAFSHREKQVLALVARGYQNREIANELFLAESTVKSHLGTSFAKLGVRSRKEAAAVLLDPAEGLRPLILDELPDSPQLEATAS
jgi:DNA-binding NarL/FixJ family response regulator